MHLPATDFAYVASAGRGFHVDKHPFISDMPPSSLVADFATFGKAPSLQLD
jgi:hypothetical protein